jgi:hypothetical protein
MTSTCVTLAFAKVQIEAVISDEMHLPLYRRLRAMRELRMDPPGTWADRPRDDLVSFGRVGVDELEPTTKRRDLISTRRPWRCRRSAEQGDRYFAGSDRRISQMSPETVVRMK